MRFARLYAAVCLTLAGVGAIGWTGVQADDATPREAWVAVGYGGRRMLSTDGLNWTITEEWEVGGGDNSNNLMSAVFAQGKFVAVGGGGGGPTAGGHVLVSTDGKTWRETWKAKNRVNPIVFGGDRFVVGGPDRSLYWSSDAETWTPGGKLSDPVASHFRGGAYGDDKFVFVGNGGGNGGTSWSAVSKNGETIDGFKKDLPGHGRIVFGARRFFMLTSHSKAALIATTDGLNWEPVVVPDASEFDWLVWTGRELFVGDWKKAFRSENGTEWQPLELKNAGGVIWSDGTRFIATGWPGKMRFSPNGRDWENSPKTTDNGINVVVSGRIPNDPK
ncbi:MAG TPA: hypothetical protein VGE52_05400 [Pirellulales bacterium]